MVEAIILVLAIAAFVSGGLTVWGSACRPATHQSGLILRTIVVGLIGTMLVAVPAWKAVNARTFQLLGGMVPRINASLPVVALTLNDGPSRQFTEEVLSFLPSGTGCQSNLLRHWTGSRGQHEGSPENR